jgi:hypothetical protein
LQGTGRKKERAFWWDYQREAGALAIDWGKMIHLLLDNRRYNYIRDGPTSLQEIQRLTLEPSIIKQDLSGPLKSLRDRPASRVGPLGRRSGTD